MARSDIAFASARSAYERRHVLAAVRGLVLAGVLVCAAIALHRTTQATWFVGAVLAATLATFGWRGGAWLRGNLAGVLAGVPVFITPAVYFLVKHGHCCPECAMTPGLSCVLLCFGTSSAVGALVGHIASRSGQEAEPRRSMARGRDESPRRFAMGAFAGALFTGLLGCGTTGYGGAVGIVIGLAAGSVTGWVFARRTAHA